MNRAWSRISSVIGVGIALACGGANGGPGGGSALCGPNGSNTCDQGRLCDSTLGCVDCETSSDCPASAPHCVVGSCVDCASNGDCPASLPACWSDNHCHGKCATGTCPNGMTCTGEGACVECLTNKDCGKNAPVCNTALSLCAVCTQNSDCPTASPRCLVRDGTCVGCLTNDDCGTAAPMCNSGFQCVHPK